MPSLRPLARRLLSSSPDARARASGAAGQSRRWIDREIDSQIAADVLEERRSLALVGQSGVGKSVALSRLVERARDKKWIALFMPRMSELTFGDGTYVRRLREPDQQWPLYERPTQAVRVLSDLYAAHAAELAQIAPTPLDDFLNTFLAAKGLPSPKNLAELVECGLLAMEKIDLDPDNCMFAVCDVFEAVVENLKQQPDVPVLFAMDEFNLILGLTGFRDESLKRIHSNAVRMTRPLRDLRSLNSSIANGVAVVAMTESSSTRPFRRERSSRIAVYGNEDPASSLESLSLCERKVIPPFTLSESMNMIELLNSSMDDRARARCHTLVGGRARMLEELVRFPRILEDSKAAIH